MSVSGNSDLQLSSVPFEGYTLSCLCRSESHASQRCWTLQTNDAEEHLGLPGVTICSTCEDVGVQSPRSQQAVS